MDVIPPCVQLDDARIRGPRISPGIVRSVGCGFGGLCFPKDVQALRTQGEKLGLPMRVLNCMLKVNEAQPQQVVNI